MADNGTQPIAPPLDQLSQLLMSIPKAGSPADGWAPPMALPSPQTSSTPNSSSQSGAVVSPQPATAAAPPIQPVSPTPTPDPAQTALTKGVSDYNDTRSKMAAIPAVNPQDYKPHWYDRLLGGLVGAGAGISDPARGAKVGSNVTHRGLINAQNSRASQIQPLLEQLNAEREEVPMLSAASQAENEGKRIGIQQASQTETGRHNQAEEATSSQQASTAAKTETAREQSESAASKVAQQRADQEAQQIQQTGKYEQGELANRNAQLNLDRQKLAASTSTIPDLKSLDAEQKSDNAALDKAQQESANQIKEDYKGFWGSIKHGFSSPEEALKADQAKFDAMRSSHASVYQTRRESLSGKGGAPAPAAGFTRIKASDGSMHDIPSGRIKDAKKKDPGLTVAQ